jgi:RNAse (barnase) inhibitor barstar
MENEYHEKSNGVLVQGFEKYSKLDTEEVIEGLREMFGDKDAFLNIINGSHDYRISKLDQQEDILVTGVTKEVEIINLNVQQTEIQRDRERIIEIVNYIEQKTKELEAMED